MYARIAYFEGGRAEMIDDLRRHTKEQFIPELKRLPGFAGAFQLFDRESGKALSLTLFDKEEDLQTGDRELDRMSPPDELRGVRRTGVERYEVAFQEIGHDAAAARLSRFEGPRERIDEMTHVAEESVLPNARQLEGWRGVLSLVDRTTGKALLMTLWESTDAMQRSEQQADRLRTETAEGSGQKIVGVERYEVASQTVTAAVGRR